MTRHKTYPFIDIHPKQEIFSQHGPDGDFGGEDLRGTDGKPVYPGCRVLRAPFFHEGLGCTVPLSWGVVRRIFRQPGLASETGCDLVVQTRDNRFFWLDTVRRTTRSTAEEKIIREAEQAAKEREAS